MNLRTPLAALVFVTATVTLAGGCKKADSEAPAAAPPAEAPAPQPGGYSQPGYGQPPSSIGDGEAEEEAGEDSIDSFSDVKSAETALETARAEIDALLASASTPPRAGGGAGASELKKGDARGRCASACRAIASMRRAGAAVCRLAGDDSDRCTKAKETLTDSEKRVAACACGD